MNILSLSRWIWTIMLFRHTLSFSSSYRTYHTLYFLIYFFKSDSTPVGTSLVVAHLTIYIHTYIYVIIYEFWSLGSLAWCKHLWQYYYKRKKKLQEVTWGTPSSWPLHKQATQALAAAAINTREYNTRTPTPLTWTQCLQQQVAALAAANFSKPREVWNPSK